MSVLQGAVTVVSVALVATKFMDCWSTAVRIQGPEDEKNPLARVAMMRFGPRVTIWAVFALVVLIVAIVGGSAYRTATDVATGVEGHLLYVVAVWAYLTLGILISIVQAEVARANWTGRSNVVSRIVLRATMSFGRRHR